MNPERLEVAILAGTMTAAGLRDLRPGRDDETLKRWALYTLGWSFCRRTGLWKRGGHRIDPAHSLDAVLGYLALLTERRDPPGQEAP